MRDLEEQFQAQFPAKVDYPDKVGLFYMYQCSAQNVSHEFREDVKAYKLADSVMLTTYVLIIDLQRGVLLDTCRSLKAVTRAYRGFKSLPMRNTWIIGLVFGRLTPS